MKDPWKHSTLVIILLILITFSVDVGHSWEKRRGDEVEVGQDARRARLTD